MIRLAFAKRLGSRIFLTFAMVLILLAGAFGIFTAHYGKQLVSQSSANELRVLNVVLSQLIQNQFSHLEDGLDDISSNEFLMNQLLTRTVNREWVEVYLKTALQNNTQLIELMIYDTAAKCVGATDPEWYKIVGKNWPFFQRGLEEFNFPPIYDAEDMARVQLVSSPIIYNDQVVGVIVAIVDLEAIYKLMDQKIGLSETTDAFLLDSDLQFITAGRSHKKGLVESHLASTTLASHLRDEFWVGQYQGADGKEVLGTALKISGYSWYVVVERNYEDVLRKITALRHAIIVTTLGLLFVFILASLGVSRSITRPLLSLVQSTRQIAAGKYNEPVHVSEEIEELGFIGRELERMRRHVASSQERLKERLTESEQLRVESARLAAIGSLAASLAHEIRNPLNAMSLLLSRLQYSGSDDTRKSIMGDLFGEIGRLDRLVSSILDYARPIQIERRSTDLKVLLESVADLYKSLGEAKGINLKITEAQSVVIQADSDRLKQCLVNLVKNSFDVLESGGLVTLACRQDDDVVVIEVSDTGPGVDLEIQPKLFSPFFTTKENGTGLGLSSVHKIVAAHGGKVELVSDPVKSKHGLAPQGAKFIIRIPTI